MHANITRPAAKAALALALLLAVALPATAGYSCSKISPPAVTEVGITLLDPLPACLTVTGYAEGGAGYLNIDNACDVPVELTPYYVDHPEVENVTLSFQVPARSNIDRRLAKTSDQRWRWDGEGLPGGHLLTTISLDKAGGLIGPRACVVGCSAASSSARANPYLLAGGVGIFALGVLVRRRSSRRR